MIIARVRGPKAPSVPLDVEAQRLQRHLNSLAILLGQVQVGFGPLGLFSDFRIRLWLPFSRLARRFLCLEAGILGRLASAASCAAASASASASSRAASALAFSSAAWRASFPARRSHGCKLLLGSFLRFLG